METAILIRLAGSAMLAAAMNLAWATNAPLKEPTTLEQAVHDGHWVFVNDSFGSHRSWIPDWAMNARPMSCAVCHGSGIGPGRTPDGLLLPSLAGAAAQYPALRGGRVMTLEQQVERCIVRGIGGRSPAPGSPEMVGLITYLTALSRNMPLGRQLPLP